MKGDYVSVFCDKEFKDLLKRLFTDSFMQKYTRFQSFEGFQYSSAVFVNWKSEIMVYSEKNFNAFVNESTDFDSWDEMVKKATDLYYNIA